MLWKMDVIGNNKLKYLMKVINIKDRLFNIINIVFYLKSLFMPHLWVHYAIPRWKKDNCNWGDDVNAILCKMISGKKVIPYQYSWFKRKHYTCIGSVLQWYSSKDAIVWGSGLLDYCKIVEKPFKVYAVRGPLTRQCLLNNNIECPEIYGDPALLFPYYYYPQIKKTFQVGVICHKSEIKEIKGKLSDNNSVLFIDIVKYGRWSDFIDKILSCEVILSSSLHGIIIADAYAIPNQWSTFTEKNAEGAEFKFHDYFLSVEKNIDKPSKILSFTDIDNVVKMVLQNWSKPKFDKDKLLSVCPFK